MRITQEPRTGWRIWVCCGLATLATFSAAAVEAAPRTRGDFAKTLAKVRASGLPGFDADGKESYSGSGSTENEVVKLLGRPDEVRPAARSGLDGRPMMLWAYGTSGRGSFPSLGEVVFGDGQARVLFGARGRPISPRLVPEKQLRRLLQQIHKLSDPTDGRTWDPRELICVVNELQPLGREKAYGVVHEYARVAAGAFTPDQLLLSDWAFVEKPGLLPLLDALFPDPASPTRLAFGVRMIGDLPVQPRVAVALNGGPPVTTEAVRSYSRRPVRPTPLRPSPTPLRELDAFLNLETLEASARAVLMRQVLRLATPALSTPELTLGDAALVAAWPGIVAERGAIRLRWDPRECRYSRAQR